MSRSKRKFSIVLLVVGILGVFVIVWLWTIKNNIPISFISAHPTREIPFSFSNPIWHGGKWEATGTQKYDGKNLFVDVNLAIHDKLIEQYSNDQDQISALLVLERFFDKEGRANAMNNEYFSTVLTPGGMPIEFSQETFGAPSKYNVQGGITYVTPIDTLLSQTIKNVRDTKKRTLKPLHFFFQEKLPAETPAGLYRPLLYFFYTKQGTPAGKIAHPENTLALAHQILSPIDPKFLERNAPWGENNDYLLIKHQVHYLPPITIGEIKTPHMPLVLFPGSYSQGSKGIISEEDKKHFQISTREISQTNLVLDPGEYALDIGLPLVSSFDQKLNPYNERIPLEPKGYLQGEIIYPDGKKETIPKSDITGLNVVGEGPFQSGQKLAWKAATTGKKLQMKQVGAYTIFLSGKLYDTFGNTYEGGGTYTCYVGKKLTFSSAVKPGTPFFVGDTYIPRFSYYPPLAGKARLEYTFYPLDASQSPQTKVIEKDTRDGSFNDTPIPFTTPGEYHVHVVAQAHSMLMGDFIGTYDSGSLVVSKENDLTVHGVMGGKFADRRIITEPRFIAPRNQSYEPFRELAFPYISGDILKIAAHPNNAILPVIEVQDRDGKNITIAPTGKNNFHPFDFPEYTDTRSYLFITSEKAGMIARSFVGTTFMEHTFWNVKGQNFGNRINASKNGDMENDVYRNFASVVLFKNNVWHTGSYVSNIAIISEKAENDRVIAPFSEPFVVTGGKPHLFVIGTGLQKPLGALFNQYLHVFPAVAGIQINMTVTLPDGTKKNLPTVSTDADGFTPAGASFKMEQPGVYKVDISATYNKKTDQDFYTSRSWDSSDVDHHHKRSKTTRNIPNRCNRDKSGL